MTIACRFNKLGNSFYVKKEKYIYCNDVLDAHTSFAMLGRYFKFYKLMNLDLKPEATNGVKILSWPGMFSALN